MSKTFAILSGAIVSNVIVAETIEDAQFVAPNCVEYTTQNLAFIGDVYDPETGLFSSPVVEEIIEKPIPDEEPAE